MSLGQIQTAARLRARHHRRIACAPPAIRPPFVGRVPLCYFTAMNPRHAAALALVALRERRAKIRPQVEDRAI